MWQAQPLEVTVSDRPVAPEIADEIDKSLGLTLISIRLPANLIEDYKLVAQLKGQLYQPLMREALALWIEETKTDLLKGVAFDMRERAKKRGVAPAERNTP